MVGIVDLVPATTEVGLVRGGSQSNGRPWGDRDTEGFLEAPELQLRAPGMALTILSIVSAAEAVTQGPAGTQSIVTVAEELRYDDWNGGELRLVAQDYSEPIVDTDATVRAGHATVLRCCPSLVAAVTFDTTNDRVLWAAHGRRPGSQVQFRTTGTLPGITDGEVLYVRDVTENSFKVSRSPHGAAVDLTGGSGTHTGNARPCLLVQWTSAFVATTAGITFTVATPGVVNHTAHRIPEGSIVTVGTGTGLPPELAANTPYWVRTPALAADRPNKYNLAATPAGAAIAFTGAGGATQVAIRDLANVAGYVHLRDRFKTYDNVVVVVPFQPIEPGPYPTDPPVVPGVTLAADVTKHEDLALALPFCWDEGIEGHGAAGVAQVVGLDATLQAGQTITADLFADGFVRVGNSKGEVASNTTTTVTVKAWIGGQPPAATNLPLHLHLPHWRNNAHHFSAGEGFLYPADDMQPGSIGIEGRQTEGVIYSRPRARLRGSYVNRTLVLSTPVSPVIGASAKAETTTTASAQMTVALGTGTDVGTLRIVFTPTTHNPATGALPFELFLRPGMLVILSGMGQTPSVDGFYRVVRMQPTRAGGSEVFVAPYDPVAGPLPVAVSGTVPAGAKVTRWTWKPQHKFGSLIPAAWRLANALGRRVVVAHLSVNSSSQVLRRDNASYGYQGVLGWWDDDTQFNWTPSDAGGLFKRWARMLTFIAPRAVRASLGASQVWKVFAGDTWQGESEAILSQAQRDLAVRTLPVFVDASRKVIADAGLSPYPAGVPVPWHWAQITSNPWELATLPVSTTSYQGTIAGDVNGQVNAAIVRMAAVSGGFTTSFDPDANPKVSFDSAHFNGIGMARNGAAIARLVLQMIDFAFSFGLGRRAVQVANEALLMLGAADAVTSLEPPNETTEARACASLLPAARDYVLQCHTWSFARQRLKLAQIENRVTTWAYAYAVPANLLKPNLVLPPDAPDEVQLFRNLQLTSPFLAQLRPPSGYQLQPATQPHVVEIEDGYRVLRTNQADAVCVYTSRNIDFSAWTPKALEAVKAYLGHRLAGALQKGSDGRRVAADLLNLTQAMIRMGAVDDYEFGTDVRVEKPVPWLPPGRSL